MLILMVNVMTQMVLHLKKQNATTTKPLKQKSNETDFKTSTAISNLICLLQRGDWILDIN